MQTGPRINVFSYSDTWFIFNLQKRKNSYSIIYIYTRNKWKVDSTIIINPYLGWWWWPTVHSCTLPSAPVPCYLSTAQFHPTPPAPPPFCPHFSSCIALPVRHPVYSTKRRYHHYGIALQSRTILIFEKILDSALVSLISEVPITDSVRHTVGDHGYPDEVPTFANYHIHLPLDRARQLSAYI